MPVKGQKTLDDANARRQNAKAARQAKPPEPPKLTDEQEAAVAGEERHLALMDPRSGYARPKALGALEKIIENNALKGAGFWRKAADALVVIKAFKLWKEATRADGTKYESFVKYAEERFGFKKTYAYDLVKAATKKPEALTEGSAREELKTARGSKPLDPAKAAGMMAKAYEKFVSVTSDQRDRAIEHEEFVAAYDATMKTIHEAFEAFVGTPADPRWITLDLSATAENEDEDSDASDDDAEGDAD